MMEEEIIVVSAVCSFLLPSHYQSFVLCCVHSSLLVVGWFSGGFVGLWACFFWGGWFLLFAFVLFFNLNLTQLITFTKVKNVVKPLKDLYNLPDDSNKGL